jgi:hypothetical protein
MRILDGARALNAVELHLTDAEAERLIESVADCRKDIAEIGMSESHWRVSDGTTEAMIFVYATQEELEAEVADRMSDAP